jgi:acyl-CoA synthetase (AMP-forming)/AMP-acid ligase II
VNIYPEDIEVAVSEVSGVHAGRVVAMGLVNDALGTESLTVVAELNAAADTQTLRAIETETRAAILAACGIAPSHVFVVPPKWIVKSTAGKISRIETRQRVLERWGELTTKPARQVAGNALGEAS